MNRLNNNLDNLELTTCLENTHHAIKNGAFKAVCVTDEMIDYIRSDIKLNPYKRTLKFYHEMFGISTTTVERIVRGSDSRTTTPGSRTNHLSNLEDLLWLPNDYTYEDVERHIDFIIRNKDKVSINHMIQVLRMDYWLIKRIIKEYESGKTTTKVYRRNFKLPEINSTAIS